MKFIEMTTVDNATGEEESSRTEFPEAPAVKYDEPRQGPMITFSGSGISFNAKNAHPTVLTAQVDWAKVAEMAAKFAPPMLMSWRAACPPVTECPIFIPSLTPDRHHECDLCGRTADLHYRRVVPA